MLRYEENACLVVVGDSPADVRLGRQLGAETIAVGTGNGSPSRLGEEVTRLGPDRITDSFAELPKTIGAGVG
jgi:phosphoglycolate phosphatase-like HAD superfamily hydrolase